MILATLCTNRQHRCLPLYIAVNPFLPYTDYKFELATQFLWPSEAKYCLWGALWMINGPTQGQSQEFLYWSSERSWNDARILHSLDHRWWIMVVSNTTQRQNALSKPKVKSMLLFRHSGDHPQAICASRTKWQLNVLSGSPWWKNQARKKMTHMWPGIAGTSMQQHDNAMSHGSLSQ